MGLKLLIAVSTLLAAEALVGPCTHLENQPEEIPQVKLHRAGDSMSAYGRSNDWQPLRISVHFGELNITEPVKTKLYGALNGTMNWLSQTLRVRPVLSRWQASQHSCGRTNFSAEFLSQHFDVDFVFYVIADMSRSGIAGYAITCQRDLDTDQPVIGLLYVNGLSHINRPEEQQVLSTVIHEAVHSLGFSPRMFRLYQKADGRKYSSEELFANATVRGKEVKMLALPTVTQRAREAFGCSTLQGLELESSGGRGTVGAHWDKRVMYNDFMVADGILTDVAYTDLTMAVFQDSGWYEVSYKYTTPIVWGSRRGCRFLTERCIDNGVPLTSDFCVNENTRGCDFLRLRKGRCSMAMYNYTLPPQYQYFPLPNFGGTEKYLDYCPVIRPFFGGDCRDDTGSHLRATYGETAGLNARCVSQSVRGDRRGSCHIVDCSSPDPTLLVGTQTVICPAAGGSVKVEGFGLIDCPPRSELCRTVPCVNNCYGFGYCAEGVCVCDDGSEKCKTSYGVYDVANFQTLWPLYTNKPKQ